jgi:hypothetical protein
MMDNPAIDAPNMMNVSLVGSTLQKGKNNIITFGPTNTYFICSSALELYCMI